MISQKTLELYTPHEAQLKFHESTARFRVADFGRQAGKSTACLNDLAFKGWEKPNQVLWFISPTYQQAKIQYRRLVAMFADIPGALKKKPIEGPPQVHFANGSAIYFKSGETFDNLRGETLHGVVIDEVRDQHPNLWSQVIRPMLTTTKGWAAFVSTPNGFDTFYDLYEKATRTENWEAFKAPSTANPLFTQEEYEAAKREMSEAEFDQEINANFRDIHQGKAYTFTDENLRDTNPFMKDPGQIMPRLSIVVGMDFNVGHMRWILGQVRNDEFYIFDEISINNTNTQQCASELVARLQGHTAGVTLIGDASGESRHTSATESDYVIVCHALDKAGIRWENRTPLSNPPVKERVNTLNGHLKAADGRVRLWINPTKCKSLKRDLERVSWKQGAETILDQTTDKSLTHASDALGYIVHQLSPMKLNRGTERLRIIMR